MKTNNVYQIKFQMIQKIGDIMKLGFSKKTLSLMTESQVNALHKRLVKEVEQVTMTRLKPGESATIPTNSKKVSVLPDGTTEITEKKSKKGKNPWAICTSSLSDEFGTSERSEWTKGQMNKYERCVKGVKKTIEEGKNPYEFLIEQKMSEIVEKHLSPKISKKDLMEAIRMKKLNEQPAPAKPITKPKPGVKPDTDFDPFISPDPDDQPEASSKGLDWFMSKVKNAGLIKKKRK